MLDPSIDMSEKLARDRPRGRREGARRGPRAGRRAATASRERRRRETPNERDGSDAHDRAGRSCPTSRRRSRARATSCATSQRILLTSHRRPDGDGTGSMAGLASLLRAQRQGSGHLLGRSDRAPLQVAAARRRRRSTRSVRRALRLHDRRRLRRHLAARRHAAAARSVRHADHARSPRERPAVRRHRGVGSDGRGGRRARPSHRRCTRAGRSRPRPRCRSTCR